MANTKVKVGTFCGAIQKQILVATCPLRKGACMWQHRDTKLCCYTEGDLDPEAFAAKVGCDPLSEPDLESLKAKIVMEFKTSNL